jgi:phage gpG-like protein
VANGSFTGSRSGVEFLEIDFDPSPIVLAAAFETFGLDIRSFREPLLRSVRQVMAPSLRKNFDEGGRPPWIPLGDITVKEKTRKGSRTPDAPLIRSGKLRRLAGQVNFWTIDGPAGEAYISPGKLGEVFYGVYHQYGTEDVGTASGFPAREWAMIQEDDANEIEEIFFEWIEERAARAGVAI